MAVYTDVTADELNEFLAGYDIGALLSYKGIAEGVENSNFLVHTGAAFLLLRLRRCRRPCHDHLRVHAECEGIRPPA